MNNNTITIDGTEYVRADSINREPTTKQIVVLQRGWVVVGDVTIDGENVTIRDASTIRIWGATKGLGELALTGPTSKTILDPTGTVRAHLLGVVMFLDVTDGLFL